MSDKGKFDLVIGEQSYAVDGPQAAERLMIRLIKDLLPSMHVVSRETGNTLPILKDNLGLRAYPRDLDDFIRTNNVVNYTMRPFSAVFVQGFMSKLHLEGMKLPYHREDAKLTKLVRAGYLTKTVRNLIEGGARRTYHYYAASPKMDKLIANAVNQPSKRINPDAKFWYALLQCVTANFDILEPETLRSRVRANCVSKAKIETLYLNQVLVTAMGCHLLTADKPENTKLENLYRDSNISPHDESRPQLYLVPKVEAALLRQIRKVVRTCVMPQYFGYGPSRKIKKASLLDRNLVKLVPTAELAILYSRKNGNYYKALREDQPVG